jgi:glycosyltransferase involved in cell wall biosynthesis
METITRPVGVYIVSETGALKPESGANIHIQAGMTELHKYFDMSLVLFCKPYAVTGTRKLNNKHQRTSLSARVRSFLKWPYLLLSNHSSFFRNYRLVKKMKPAFIYERAGYLNYNGLLIARRLRIPHFYEVNGIMSNDYKKYFPAIWTKVARYLEKNAYKTTTLGFYVGGINTHLNIYGEKAVVIQNGIYRKFADQFADRKNTIDKSIHILFVGYAMDHHRLDILSKALNLVNEPGKFHLHLIGSGLESLKEHLPRSMTVCSHGLMDHDKISTVISEMHVGIIPYALDYYSNVKTFLYGAAKLIVVLPAVKNYKDIFSDDEVVFIRNGDVADLAAKLNDISHCPQKFASYGQKVYDKVISNFTWESIYRKIESEIEKHI